MSFLILMAQVINFTDLKKISTDLKNQDQTIVLVTGVFDILHKAHLKFLQKAKSTGNILFVGLESDFRVQKIKGQFRPVCKLEQRIKNLSQIRVVDYIFALPEKFDQQARERLVQDLKPDVLAVSAHTLHLSQKRNLLKKYGGELKIVMSQDKNISTTQILEKRLQNGLDNKSRVSKIALEDEFC